MPAIPNPYLHRVTVPTPPPRVLPYYERPAYRRAIAALRWVVSPLFLLILGAALYPSGEPTRPLRVAEETPATPLATTP